MTGKSILINDEMFLNALIAKIINMKLVLKDENALFYINKCAIIVRKFSRKAKNLLP